MCEMLTPLSSELLFHLLKNTPKECVHNSSRFYSVAARQNWFQPSPLQLPWAPVIRNCQENEKNWKHPVVEILLLKVTMKRFFEKHLFINCDPQENFWAAALLISMGIAGVHHFLSEDLKMPTSWCYGDCPPCNWAVKNTMKPFRVHSVQAVSSNHSLFWSFRPPCSSASTWNTFYWSEWEGRSARIYAYEEAHTWRHVLLSLPCDFHDMQDNALELRQHFTVCHLTWLTFWAGKKWCEAAYRLPALLMSCLTHMNKESNRNNSNIRWGWDRQE